MEKGELLPALEPIIEDVWQRVERAGSAGRTITLKVKFADFRQMTRAHSFSVAVASRTEFERTGRNLLCAQLPFAKGVRLLGLTLSILERNAGQSSDAHLAPLLDQKSGV